MSFFTELKRRNVIRVAVLYAVFAWLMLQVADVLVGLFGLPDWSLRFVGFVLLLGFPATLVFSWVFELTPEGIKREKHVDRSQSVTHRTARKLDLAVIVLLVLAMAMFAVDRFLPDERAVDSPPVAATPSAEPGSSEESSPRPDGDARPSVAVLPFVNMSPDPDQEYFSDGLSDTLIHVLAEIEGLKVTARTSSFQFKGKQVDVRDVADDLGVANILEGSVQKAGDRLRIIAQLIDASDGSHLWSATFDRSTDDIFAIQDEIATEIVKALRGTLLEEDFQRIAQRYEPSLEAYQMFLRGRQAMVKRRSETLDEAQKYFERALELDPDYPLALVYLGDTYLLQTVYSDRTDSEYLELAEPLYRRAVALNPELGEAYVSLGQLHEEKNEFEKALEYFERGIELAPGYPTAWHWYALALEARNRHEEALEAWLKAAELDPLSAVIQVGLAAALHVAGRHEQARELANEVVLANPDFPLAYYRRGSLELWRGDLGRHLYWMREAARLDPDNIGDQAEVCWLSMALPDNRPAWECIEHLTEVAAGSEWAVSLQMAKDMIQGRIDEAIEKGRRYLEKADPAARDVRWILADAYALAGEYQRSADLILSLEPELDSENNGGKVTATNWRSAIGLAYLWRELGEPDRAAHLLKQVWPFIERDRRPAAAAARAHMLAGRPDEAVDALRDAIDSGWVLGWRWTFVHDPIFEPLRERKDLRQLGEQLHQRLAKQQEWLEAQPPLHEVIEAGKLDSI